MPAKQGLRSGFIGRIAIACAAAATLTLTGCYSNWPPIEGRGQTDPNNLHTRSALAEAGRWALKTYKPSQPIAWNLPAGLRRSGIIEVVGAIGGGSVPLTEETASSHVVFHLPRFALRNDKLEIDVVVPIRQGANGPEYEMTRLSMVGRGSSWRVEVARKWETLVRVPEFTYLPETDAMPVDDPMAVTPWPDEPNTPRD